MNMLRKMLSGERLYFNTIFKSKKGQNTEIEVSASPIKDDGKVFGILVTGRDITERRRAEEETRDIAEKYRSLVENADDVIITFDLKGNIVTVNRAIEEYGFKKNGIVNKNMLKFVSRKYWPRLLADLDKVARGKPIKGELELATPIGNRIIEYRGNPMIRGNEVVGIQSVLRDITERKKMEDELAESEERFRALFEQSPIGICIATLDGSVINANRTMLSIIKYSQKEFKNQVL
jgi:PAS domain S-box-containing protein